MSETRNPGKSAEYLKTVLTDEARMLGGLQRRFIKPIINENHNKILYALLYSYDIKVSDLADYLFVDSSTVKRWINGRYKPDLPYQERICNLLQINSIILFGKVAYNYSDVPRFELEGINRTYLMKPLSRRIVKKILFGLIWLYDLTTHQVSQITGMNRDILSRLMFTERMPQRNNDKVIELMKLFNMPYDILFMNFEEKDIKSELNWYKDTE